MGLHTATLRDGTIIDVATLIGLMESREPERIAFRNLRGVTRSRQSGFSERRLAQADASIPGIVDESNLVIDGRHRIIKLQANGETSGWFWRATQEDIRQACIYDVEGEPMSTKRNKSAGERRKEAALRREAARRAAIRKRAAVQREKRKRAAKSVASMSLPVVRAEDVRLEKSKGTKRRGGGQGGGYWHIFVEDERVGHIYINVIEEAPFGAHASIQVFLNQDQRGRRIGRVAYRLACNASSHDEVFAHMRKSNLPSKRAAEEAGFVVFTHSEITQLAMVWRRIK